MRSGIRLLRRDEFEQTPKDAISVTCFTGSMIFRADWVSRGKRSALPIERIWRERAASTNRR
jgi:hypothetical protein